MEEARTAVFVGIAESGFVAENFAEATFGKELEGMTDADVVIGFEIMSRTSHVGTKHDKHVSRLRISHRRNK